MSIALRRVRDRISMKLRDTDARKGTFDTVYLDNAICEAYLALQGRLPPPDLYTANAFTIGAGGDTFTMPTSVTQWTGNDGGAEYAGDFRIQLASNGQFLQKRTVEELDSMRNRLPTVSPALSIPYLYTLWEESDQDVQGRCYPGAKVAEACNLFRTFKADDLRDFVGAGTDTLDNVEVMFSRLGTVALVYHVCAELVASMPEDDLKLRRLNPAVAQLWMQMSEDALYNEACARHDIDSVGRVQRWVS